MLKAFFQQGVSIHDLKIWQSISVVITPTTLARA